MSFLRSRWLNLVARFVIGGLFFYAAFEKVLQPAAFAMSVRAYKLIPFSLSNLFAICVAWSEIVAATLLLLGIFTRKAAGAIFLLLIVFFAAISTVLARHMAIDCGCFGEGSATASWLLLVRNAALIFGTVLIIRYNDGWLSLGTRAFGARKSPTS